MKHLPRAVQETMRATEVSFYKLKKEMLAAENKRT